MHDRSKSASSRPLRFKPELASLNMGSMNFGLFPMLNRYKDFKHEWEPQELESSRDLVFRNTFKDIEYVLRHCCGNRHALRVRVLRHRPPLQPRAISSTASLVKPPLFIQTVFGILGGIGTHAEDVMHMRRTADRLFGDHYHWSVLGAGRMQMPIAAMAAAMGGHVRVGLEDSLWIGRGRLASQRRAGSPRAQHHRGARPAPATPDEAREILDLKGADTVSF